MSPRELAYLLSCKDSRFSALTEDCKDADDIIGVLRDNITFLDYDLLHYLAKATEDKHLSADITDYVAHLEDYLQDKLLFKFVVDKEMGILPQDKRLIKRLKIILSDAPFKCSQVQIVFSVSSMKVKAYVVKILTMLY